jgi:hypothetical protein
MALRDVMEHAVKAQQDIGASRSGSRGIRGMRGMLPLALCVAVIALCVWSFAAKPDFIWGASELPAERREPNMRLAMYFLGQRIEAARAQSGQYPGTLADISDSVDGVTYRLTSDSTWELLGTVDSSRIVLRSTDSASTFLGPLRSMLPAPK